MEWMWYYNTDVLYLNYNHLEIGISPSQIYFWFYMTSEVFLLLLFILILPLFQFVTNLLNVAQVNVFQLYYAFSCGFNMENPSDMSNA